jgi:predicted RNase H-like HicB family nuclease
MHYPAILSTDGNRTLITFPDLPGCEAQAWANENMLKLAQAVLTDWLRGSLNDRGAPPPPSEEVTVSGAARALVVPVPDDLARALEDRWQWAEDSHARQTWTP